MIRAFLIATILILMSCKVEPEPIHYGEELCAYCKMTIVDARFASELVTNTGKVYKFDAIECMIDFMSNAQQRFDLQLISTFDKRILQAASDSYYLRSDNLPSPMGMHISGFSNEQTASAYADSLGGELYTWQELIQQYDHWKQDQSVKNNFSDR